MQAKWQCLFCKLHGRADAPCSCSRPGAPLQICMGLWLPFLGSYELSCSQLHGGHSSPLSSSQVTLSLVQFVNENVFCNVIFSGHFSLRD